MNTRGLSQKIFPLEPQHRERVWGGQRLKASEPPIGEAWVAFEDSRVREGPCAGQTVAELTSRHGAEFLGASAAARHGTRFPLLVKLLDCADWLSVQVHPDDEQAERMVGPGQSGKTEAWHFLEVEPGAHIIAGLKPRTTPQSLERAIREGRIRDVAQELEVEAGETVYLPAGTLHALGPGMLLYELQQSSDTTYRVYDWDRPAEAGRELHTEEAIAVTDPRKAPVVSPPVSLTGTAAAPAIRSPFFALDILQIADTALHLGTEGETFHILTVTSGMARITCGAESVSIGTYETALVAGLARDYEINAADAGAGVLLAAVSST